MDRIEEIMRRCFSTLNPDLAAFYIIEKNNLVLNSFKGCTPDRKSIPLEEESIEFITESMQTLSVLNILEEGKEFFKGILINGRMTCGIASPYTEKKGHSGIFFFNYLNPYRFNFSHIQKIEKTLSSRRES